MKRIRRSPLSISLAMLVLSSSLLTACGDGSGPVSTTSSPTEDGGLKLGALLPITGDLSSIGQNMPEAVNLAVSEINACGGINDKPVTLVTEDTQTDPTAGSAAMTKLAEVDKVAGVVGAFASSVSSSAVDIAVRQSGDDGLSLGVPAPSLPNAPKTENLRASGQERLPPIPIKLKPWLLSPRKKGLLPLLPLPLITIMALDSSSGLSLPLKSWVELS